MHVSEYAMHHSQKQAQTRQDPKKTFIIALGQRLLIEPWTVGSQSAMCALVRRGRQIKKIGTND